MTYYSTWNVIYNNFSATVHLVPQQPKYLSQNRNEEPIGQIKIEVRFLWQSTFDNCDDVYSLTYQLIFLQWHARLKIANYITTSLLVD